MIERCFSTAHSHPQSLDSGARPEAFAKREVELGSGTITCTDHGTLAAVYDCYKLGKENGLIAIPGCLMPGQEIHTVDGMKTVEEIQVGDLVLTHKGRFRRVLRTMTRNFDGDVFTLFEGRKGSRGLTVTGEHPVFVCGQDKIPKFVRADQIQGGRVRKWGAEGSLRYNYRTYVMVPRVRAGSVKSISIKDHLGPFGFTFHGRSAKTLRVERNGFSWKFPRSLPLTDDLAYFLGLYAAEGWAATDGQFGLAFNIKEREFIDFVVNFLKGKGITAKATDRPSQGGCEVTACCVPFAHLLLALCGKGAGAKKVPREIMCSRGSRFKTRFLDGVLDGDGKKGTANDLKTTSKDLAWGCRLLAIGIGSVTTPKVAPIYTENSSTPYYLCIKKKAKRRRSFWVNGGGATPNTFTGNRSGGGGTWRAMGLREVVKSHYTGPVFNFEVEEDNSYVSDFILHNCEAYFRDDNCPLLQKIGVPRTDTVPRGSDKEEWRAAHPEGSYIDYLKYYHLTLHFQDYDAYLCAVRLLSKADLRAEQHGSEKKPLFDWNDVEELASHNVTASSSCLVGMVSRHLIRAEPGSPRVAAATAYFERLRHLFGKRFYVGMFPHVCTHDWVNLVAVTVTKEGGGTEELRFGPDKLVRTNTRECRAHEWARNFPAWGDKLVGVSHYRKWHDESVARQVVSVEHKEGFFQNECRPAAPGGDVQWGCNKFALSMADKYKIPVLIEDDSHFAHPEEHVVQTVRLAQHGGNFRFHHSYHRRSNAEIYEYFKTQMGIPEARIDEWVETSHAWAEGFKGFKFDATPKLPSNFFPADSLAFTRELVKRHGRESDDPAYRERLETEIELLHRNGKLDWLPYFQLLEEVCRVVSNQGDLTGIGRGSAGGSLLAYYLEITHLDPIEHGLSFERFLTLDRIVSGKRPDIDQDLARRDWLLGFDTHVIEFEAEDGTLHVVPEHFRVDTDLGLMTIGEILAGGGKILWPWWVREPAPARVLRIVRTSRDPASGLPAHYDGYLRMRFPRCVAQVSTTSTMKLKAAVRDVSRLFHRKCDRCYAEYHDGADRCPSCDVYMRGFVPDDIEDLVKRMEEPPQNVDDLEFCIGYERDDTGRVPGSIETDEALRAYVAAYPREWEVTMKAMGLPRSAGRHPCAFIIADRPIEEFIPLRTVGGERVTQFTAEGVEAVGGLKVDFLRVNSLGDVEVTIRLVQERHGGVLPTQVLGGRRVLSQRLVPLAGPLHDIWALPDAPKVYSEICQGETEAVFQIHTGGAQRWLTCTDFPNPKKEGARLISSLADLAVFTALDRPGPLDYMVKSPDSDKTHNVLVEYYHRARGVAPSPTIPAAVGRLLPETHGVIVYQEQVQKIYQFVTDCTLVEAEKFRQDVAKKEPAKIEAAYKKFMERGTEKLGADDAQTIWDSLVTFSAYGFNKAHATAYGATAYACAWLKHHYPLEWWTAVLRNASAKGEKEEIAYTFWPFIQDIVEMPDIRTTSETWEIVGDKIRAPASILKGLGEVAHAQLVKYAPYTDLLDFVGKMKLHQEANRTAEGKPGRNALHSGMVYSLIVSGVLDAFFPPDSTIHNCLALYDAAAREVWGKKKKPIAGEYTVPDAVGRYQIRKGVLEIYNSDLRPLFCAVEMPPCLTFDGKRMRYHATEWSRDERRMVETKDLVVGGKRLEELAAATPTGGGWRCAALAYVESAEKFKRGRMEHPAWDLILEVGGAKLRVRHWSRHDGTLPDIGTGSVVATVLTRTDPKYGFNASSLTVLREPMPAKIKVEKKPKGAKNVEASTPDEAADDPDVLP